MFVGFVVGPEYRRTQAFQKLMEKGSLRIQAPQITMFGGGPPTTVPLKKPIGFSVRQTLAAWSGVETTPWYGDGRLIVVFRDGEATAEDVALAFSLKDMRELHLTAVSEE